MLTKKQIKEAVSFSVEDLISREFTFEELYEMGLIEKEFYPPSDTYEYFHDGYFYNLSGQQLRDPEDFNPRSEGYTPFGDE